jgi:hypothetical protein
MVTFKTLCKLEPRLQDLETQIREAGEKAGTSDVLTLWFGYPTLKTRTNGFKAKMANLVGWYRDPVDGVLSSSDAYSVAYASLFSLLEKSCRAKGGAK